MLCCCHNAVYFLQVCGHTKDGLKAWQKRFLFSKYDVANPNAMKASTNEGPEKFVADIMKVIRGGK